MAWMAFYVDDFLSATTNLSRAALGSYVLLILAYWRNRGPLKDSDVILAATARCSRAEWRRDREILETFFEIREGKWHHPRIDHELQVAVGQSMAGSISGTAGNERRWKSSRTDRERDANATRTRHEREPNPIANGSLSHHPPSTYAIAPVEESCAEAPASPPTVPPVMIFPTCGKGAKEWGLSQEKIDEYLESFPGVDVMAQLRLARQWCIDTPKKRKTPVGMPSFLTRWLSSAQNRGDGRVVDFRKPARSNALIPTKASEETRAELAQITDW